MKKCLLFMLAVLPMVFFTACSSDDDNSTESGLMGTWISNEYDSNDTLFISKDGSIVEHEGSNHGTRLEYYNGKYTVSRNKINIHWQNGKVWTSYTKQWTSLKDAEETVVITYSLDKNKLQWLSVEGEEDSDPITYYRK